MLLSRDFQNPRMTLRKFRSLEKEKWPQSQLGLDSESGCVCVCVPQTSPGNDHVWV